MEHDYDQYSYIVHYLLSGVHSGVEMKIHYLQETITCKTMNIYPNCISLFEGITTCHVILMITFV